MIHFVFDQWERTDSNSNPAPNNDPKPLLCVSPQPPFWCRVRGLTAGRCCWSASWWRPAGPETSRISDAGWSWGSPFPAGPRCQTAPAAATETRPSASPCLGPVGTRTVLSRVSNACPWSTMVFMDMSAAGGGTASIAFRLSIIKIIEMPTTYHFDSADTSYYV